MSVANNKIFITSYLFLEPKSFHNLKNNSISYKNYSISYKNSPQKYCLFIYIVYIQLIYFIFQYIPHIYINMMHVKIIRTPTEVIVKRFVKFRKCIVWNCIIKEIERKIIKHLFL